MERNEYNIMNNYGKELILDLHGCDVSKFTREEIERYFIELCDLIDMERADLHFWDDLDTPEDEKQTEPHLVGTSAIQFIMTSNVTIHTLDLMERVYLNIFSCKEFSDADAKKFSLGFFGGEIVNTATIDRV